MMKLLQFLFILGTFWKGQYTFGSKVSNNVHVGRKLLTEGGEDSTLQYVYFSEKVTVTAISAEKVAAGKDGGTSLDMCAKPDGTACGEGKIELKDGTEVSGIVVFNYATSVSAPEVSDAVSDKCKLHGWGGGEAPPEEGGGEAKAEATAAAPAEGGRKRSIIKREPRMAADKKAIPVTVTKADSGDLDVKATEDADKMFAGDAGGAIECDGKLVGLLVSISDDKTGKGILVQNILSAVDEGSDEGGAGGTTGAPGVGTTISASTIVTTLPIFAITFFTYWY